MKFITQLSLVTIGALALLGVSIQSAQAGAEHYEFPFEVLDYNDCTGEDVYWTAVISETLLINETPSGQVVIMDHWSWEATIEGLSTGYEWFTKGVSPYVETFSTDGSLTGGNFWIENSMMQPITPGAPAVRLDVHVKMQYNAAGDLVVDRFNYTYHCVGN